MRKKILTILSFLICISCTQKEVKIETATKPLDEYISQNQDKVVIAVFTANWGATGPLLEKAIDDKSIKKYLAKFPVKIFIYNCTENDSIGSQQVQKYGLKASPTALVIKKPNQEEIWIRPSIKVEELLNQLKKEMEQS